MSDAARLQNLKKAFSMSFDMGLLVDNAEVTEERSRMTAKLLRGKMLAMQNPTPLAPPEPTEKEVDEKENKYEPDWSSFEDQYAKDLLPSPGGMEKTSKFLGEVVDILLDYVKKSNDRSVKVLDFNHPNVLQETLGHCLEIPATPRDLEQILSDCKETLKFGVKTAHPRFFNQLSSGLDMIALAGEWLCATANANMFTYEIAPVFTLMEEVTLQKMREYVGWLDGDGIFAPGGAISNLYAINAARHKFFPDCKHKGMASIPHLVVYTGEQSHYSIKQAGALLGLGAENVVAIKCDDRGKMMVDELEKHIIEDQRQGKRPYMVSATAGTTVMGAFDRLHAIADLCEKYKLWMHVDAAWGGGALLSRKRRHLLDGVHRADSVTWNPHKMMGTILQCSAVLLKEKDLLAACNSMHADYLFQQDKHYDTSYDTGDKAIQCGRRNDVFKLWLMWRAKGDMGFEAQIEKVFRMSEHLQDQIRAREGFEFVMDKPEYTNVCFFYVPTFLRSHERGFSFDVKLNQVAPKVKAMMMEKGTTMVGYQPLGKIPNFFRMVISNPAAESGDVDFLLDEIQRLGEEIEPGDIQSPHK